MPHRFQGCNGLTVLRYKERLALATDPTQDRREFPTQLSRGNVRVHISTIRVLGTARSDPISITSKDRLTTIVTTELSRSYRPCHGRQMKKACEWWKSALVAYMSRQSQARIILSYRDRICASGASVRDPFKDDHRIHSARSGGNRRPGNPRLEA